MLKHCFVLFVLIFTPLFVYCDDKGYIKTPIVRINETLEVDSEIIDLNGLFYVNQANEAATTITPISIKFINNTAFLGFIKYDENTNRILLAKPLVLKEICKKKNSRSYSQGDYDELLNSEHKCQLNLQFIALSRFKFIEIPIEIEASTKPIVASIHFKHDKIRVNLSENVNIGYKYILDGVELVVKNPDYTKLKYKLDEYLAIDNETITKAESTSFELFPLLNGKKLTLILKTKPNTTSDVQLCITAVYELNDSLTLTTEQNITVTKIDAKKPKTAQIIPLECEQSVYNIQIPYNTGIDTNLIQIRLKNQTTSTKNRIVYSMITKTLRHMNTNIPFQINDTNGNIKLSSHTFNTKYPSYRLEVKATYEHLLNSTNQLDNYLIPAFCRVIINISYALKINVTISSSIKKFQHLYTNKTNGSYTMRIDEPLSKNKFLSKIEVSDLDVQNCTFSLNDGDNFYVSHEKLAKNLMVLYLFTSEKISTEQKFFNPIITVSNKNQTYSIDYQITVTPLNPQQNEPFEFEQPEYAVNITRVLKPLDHLVKFEIKNQTDTTKYRFYLKDVLINATDDDKTAKQFLNLNLNEYFYLDYFTGILYLLKPLHKSDDPSLFEFNVYAENKYEKRSNASVRIRVVDGSVVIDEPTISNFIKNLSLNELDINDCIYNYQFFNKNYENYKFVKLSGNGCESLFDISNDGCLRVNPLCLNEHQINSNASGSIVRASMDGIGVLKSGVYDLKFKMCTDNATCSNVYTQNVEILRDLFLNQNQTVTSMDNGLAGLNFTNGLNLFFRKNFINSDFVRKSLIDTTILVIIFSIVIVVLFFVVFCIVVQVRKRRQRRQHRHRNICFEKTVSSEQQQQLKSNRFGKLSAMLIKLAKCCKTQTRDNRNVYEKQFQRNDERPLDVRVSDDNIHNISNDSEVTLNELIKNQKYYLKQKEPSLSNTSFRSNLNFINKSNVDLRTSSQEGIYSVQKAVAQQNKDSNMLQQFYYNFTPYHFESNIDLKQSCFRENQENVKQQQPNETFQQKKLTLKQLKKESAINRRTNSIDSLEDYGQQQQPGMNVYRKESSQSHSMLSKSSTNSKLNEIIASIV